MAESNDGSDSRKKRGADSQLGRSDLESECGDDGAHVTEGAFQKASTEVMAKRRIITAKRPAAPAKPPSAAPATSDGGATSSNSSSNPFASTVLKAGGEAKGSASSPDEPEAKKAKPAIFGASTGFSGFAAAASSSGGFGSASSSGGGFGSSNGNGSSSGGFLSSFGATKKDAGDSESKSADAGGDEAAAEAAAAPAPAAAITSTTSASLFGTSGGTSKFSFAFGKSASDAAGSGDAEAGGSAANHNKKPLVDLPTDVDLKTGEEDEIQLMNVRCKSYIWIKAGDAVDASAAKANSDGQTSDNAPATTNDASSTSAAAAHPSVAPSAAFTTAKAQGDKPDAETQPSDPKKEQAKQQEDEAEAQDQQQQDNAKTDEQQPQKQQVTTDGTWKELGIGPLRVLQKTGSLSSPVSATNDDDRNQKGVRLVQRRESTPNGGGTKVIVNFRLWKESNVQSISDKHITVTTIMEDTSTATYLFKFKEAKEACDFRSTLEILMLECQSV